MMNDKINWAAEKAMRAINRNLGCNYGGGYMWKDEDIVDIIDSIYNRSVFDPIVDRTAILAVLSCGRVERIFRPGTFFKFVMPDKADVVDAIPRIASAIKNNMPFVMHVRLFEESNDSCIWYDRDIVVEKGA